MQLYGFIFETRIVMHPVKTDYKLKSVSMERETERLHSPEDRKEIKINFKLQIPLVRGVHG